MSYISESDQGGYGLRKVHIDSVKPGSYTAKPVWSETGSILLGKGVKLNERYIQRLKMFGIHYIYLEDDSTADIIPEEPIRDETRKKAVETVYSTMKEIARTLDLKRKIAVPELGQTYEDVYKDILNDLIGRRNVLFNLSVLHEKDGYLFHHSVNVGILSGIIGMAKGYSREKLLELGMGGLLFDIGMTFFPDELWKKGTALTTEQRARLQKHTEEGFDILRRQYGVSLLSAHCALQHHERYDGSGYPRGLKGDEIHEYAQIVGLADVYCALCSPRSYRKAYSPSEAVEFLYAIGNQWFDLELIKLFTRHIAIYPVASTVLLNTGQVGVVTAVNSAATHRPIVRIIEDPQGVPVLSPYELDLNREVNITIIKEL